MKILIPFILATLVACSSNEEAKIAANVPQGCDTVIQNNTSLPGTPVTIKATFAGCHTAIVLNVELRNAAGLRTSQYRAPVNCDVTEQTVSFAAKGETLYIGLVGCGGSPVGNAAYTLTINGKTFNSKIGNTVTYIVQ